MMDIEHEHEKLIEEYDEQLRLEELESIKEDAIEFAKEQKLELYTNINIVDLLELYIIKHKIYDIKEIHIKLYNYRLFSTVTRIKKYHIEHIYIKWNSNKITHIDLEDEDVIYNKRAYSIIEQGKLLGVIKQVQKRG